MNLWLQRQREFDPTWINIHLQYFIIYEKNDMPLEPILCWKFCFKPVARPFIRTNISASHVVRDMEKFDRAWRRVERKKNMPVARWKKAPRNPSLNEEECTIEIVDLNAWEPEKNKTSLLTRRLFLLHKDTLFKNIFFKFFPFYASIIVGWKVVADDSVLAERFYFSGSII